MDEEDDVFLKAINQKRDASKQCSEELFEEVMNFFETTAQSKQPYAAVDNTPVMSFDEIEESFVRASGPGGQGAQGQCGATCQRQ